MQRVLLLGEIKAMKVDEPFGFYYIGKLNETADL